MTASSRPSTHRYHDIGRSCCGLCGRRRAAHPEISTAAPAQPDNARETGDDKEQRGSTRTTNAA